METKKLKKKFDCLAPDGSEIRLMPILERGSMAHCTLNCGETSKATYNKTVEEIWYVLEGKGEIWRKTSAGEETTELSSETAIILPVKTHFQFRNIGDKKLKIIIVTMPPWPGENEAALVEGPWNPHHQNDVKKND